MIEGVEFTGIVLGRQLDPRSRLPTQAQFIQPEAQLNPEDNFPLNSRYCPRDSTRRSIQVAPSSYFKYTSAGAFLQDQIDGLCSSKKPGERWSEDMYNLVEKPWKRPQNIPCLDRDNISLLLYRSLDLKRLEGLR